MPDIAALVAAIERADPRLTVKAQFPPCPGATDNGVRRGTARLHVEAGPRQWVHVTLAAWPRDVAAWAEGVAACVLRDSQ